MNRPFTGRHMLAIMILFFGVVIAVNVLMARLALGTFGGTVVENSYVASQRFNGWLEEARRQDALGWHAAASLDDARHVEMKITHGGGALKAASATATARHPLGRMEDVRLSFTVLDPGRLRSVETLPPGRWSIHATIRRGNDHMRLIGTVQ